MSRLYLLLLSLLLLTGSAQAQSTILFPLFPFHRFPGDPDAYGAASFPLERHADGSYASIQAIPYDGITPDLEYFMTNDCTTDVLLLEFLNAQISTFCGNALQCIEVSGINWNDPVTSKGLIYLRLQPLDMYDASRVITLVGSDPVMPVAHIYQLEPNWLSFLDHRDYMRYGLDHLAAGTNIRFRITGPPAWDGSTYSLRRMVVGQHYTAWPAVATFDAGLVDGPETFPSAVIEVPATLLAEGEYVLVNDTWGMPVSNVTTFITTGYQWMDQPGESSPERALTLDANGDSKTWTVSVPPDSDVALLRTILNDPRYTVSSDQYHLTFRLTGEERFPNEILLTLTIECSANTGPTPITLTTGLSDRFFSDIPNTFTQPGGSDYLPTGLELEEEWNWDRARYEQRVTVHRTRPGCTYNLYLFTGEPGVLLHSIAGNGNDIAFTEFLFPGVYYIEEERAGVSARIGKKFNMNTPDLFLQIPHLQSDSAFITFEAGQEFREITVRKEIDFHPSTLEAAVQLANGMPQGQLRVEYQYAPWAGEQTDSTCTLFVTPPVNYAQTAYNTSIPFIFGTFDENPLEIPIEIPLPLILVIGNNATLPMYEVTGTWNDEAHSRFNVRLSGSREGVTYTLVKVSDFPATAVLNTPVASQGGTGAPITFTNLTQKGTYKIVVTHWDGTRTEMQGAAEMYIPPGTPAGNPNRIETKTYTTPSTYVTDITYTDGFGRKLQEVAAAASPAGGDIIKPYVYGAFGRTEKEYLPYARPDGNGSLHAAPLLPGNWQTYGAADQAYAYAATHYDDSPLNRVVGQTGPGEAWHTAGKGTTIAYALNTANEVRKFRVDETGNLTMDGHYNAGTLQKLTATDEDGGSTITYTDNREQVILSVAFEGTNRLETHSVYDDRGLLRYTLPPEASHRTGTTVDPAVLQQHAYRYHYDLRGRMVRKQLPGCEPVYLVYDGKDRIVLSQDGKQRAENANKWSYMLYDRKNRPVETGETILTAPLSHEALQTAATATYNYLPEGTRTPLQYTLYDSYTPTANIPVHAFTAHPDYATAYHPLVIGILTGISIRIIDTDTWLTATTYYDEYGRTIQTVSNNLQGGTSRVETKYDFTGNPVRQRESHSHPSRTDIVETTYTYDSRSRLLASSTTLNGGDPASVAYSYDAVGRPVTKTTGNTTETTNYNIRGWLTGKAGKHHQTELFSTKLRYQDPATGAEARWNGNISEWEWKHQNSEASLYGFTYDGANRLTQAIHKQKNGSSWTELPASYTERGITYDLDGNIKTLQRTAAGTTVDNLTYTYTGNRLTALSEAVSTAPPGDIYPPGNILTGTYTYDPNGNMTADSRKATTYTYNTLNRLKEVRENGTLKAHYTWLADGAKLRVRDAAGNGFDYLGSLTYISTYAGLQLEAANFPGGIIRAVSANTQEINCLITDHLGSVRAVIGQNGAILEQNDYYPFGAKHLRPDYPQNENRYTYNGKEEQTTGNLSFLDHGFRMYDPETGRWGTVDPLAGEYPWMSPYVYCSNNPINRIDPTGLFDIKTGTIEKGDNLTKIMQEINDKFGTNLTINDIAKENNIEDVNKIQVGNKIILPGKNLELSFDLESLEVTDATYDIDMPGLSWKGTSGRPGYQSSEFQSLKDKGPIPEGSYMVDPAQTQNWENISIFQQAIAQIGRGEWRGGTDSWGTVRTWLAPIEGTSTFGRNNFSIHGGKTPGSAGCIDLTNYNNSFHDWFKTYGKPIKLNVKY